MTPAFFLLAALATAATDRSSSTSPKAGHGDPAPAPIPEWIGRGSTVASKRVCILTGVGASSPGIRNDALRASQALAAARSELRKLADTLFATVAQQTGVTLRDAGAPESTLFEGPAVAQWVGPDRTGYARAELDAATLVPALVQRGVPEAKAAAAVDKACQDLAAL